MRLTILILTGTDLLLLAAGILKLWLSSLKSDQAGQGMTLAYVIIGTIAALLLLAPASLLAYYNKLLWLAWVLTLLASVFVLIVLFAE